jgi:hypothetical protein
MHQVNRDSGTSFLLVTHNESVAQCRDRNGAERTRLQPHARNEHRRHQAAPGGNRGFHTAWVIRDRAEPAIIPVTSAMPPKAEANSGDMRL